MVLAAVCIGRHEDEPAALARKVPLFARTDMVEQGAVFILQKHCDVVNAGVDHIGQHEVDDPVAAAERNGRDGALIRKLSQIALGIERKDNA